MRTTAGIYTRTTYYSCWILLSLLVAAIGMSLTRGFFASILSNNKQSSLLLPFLASSTTPTSMNKNKNSNTNDISMDVDPYKYTFPVPPETSQLEAPLHLVVLVHGWLGNPTELSVLQQALETQALNLRTSNNSNDDTNTSMNQQPLLLVHSATSNDGRTTDGIAAGGKRLASEINHWVAALSSQLPPQTLSKYPVTLSLVGNSLGGLYARYALSEINWKEDNNNNVLLPAVFVSTVTPHLGVAAPHTYLTLPNPIEYGVATVLKETGRDLFRVTTTIQQMTVEARFVQPLRRFRRRLALANAHNTDFQVPCSTAAFLSKNSDTVSNHRRRNDEPLLPHAVLAVETTRMEDEEDSTCTTSQDPPGDDGNNKNQQQLSSDELAARLDALGWTKIFCDVRSHLPSFNPLASSSAVSSSSSSSSSQDNDNDDETDAEKNNSKEKDDSSSNNGYSNKESFTSSELWEAFANFLPQDGRLHLPFGHQVLVANAKNAKYAAWTQGGRVVMQELAQTLVRDIVATTATTTIEESNSIGSSSKVGATSSSIPSTDVKE